MNRPLIQLILVRLREFYREPGILFWSLLFPVLMAWGLGIAFNKKPDMVKTIALVQTSTDSTNELYQFFLNNNIKLNEDSIKKQAYYMLSGGNDNEGKVHLKLLAVSWDQSLKMLKKGESTIVLETKGDNTIYHFDKNNSEAQLTYLQVTTILHNKPAKVQNTEVKPMTQKGTRYVDFLVPGLIAMNLMMSTMWGVSYSLIEARTKKMLRRMVVTPMPRWEYIASHFAARFILCSTEAIIIYTFAKFYFDIEITGSILAIVAVFISGLIAFFGISVLMASCTSKTQIGNGMINLVVMPMMICSGIFFSYHNFPDKVIPIIQSFPLTMIADGIRSVFIEGAGLNEVWKPIVILNLIGFTGFGIGLKLYKWY